MKLAISYMLCLLLRSIATKNKNKALGNSILLLTFACKETIEWVDRCNQEYADIALTNNSISLFQNVLNYQIMTLYCIGPVDINI